MNRMVTILVLIGVSFMGATALVIQRRNFTTEANSGIFELLTVSSNMLIVVVAFAVIFVGGVALLFGTIKAMGGR